MKQIGLFILLTLCVNTVLAQVGIGTTSPQGALDINSTTLGVVIPRVTNLEAVTDASGSGSAVNGTIVYDVQRDKICYRIDDQWVCTGISSSGSVVTETEILIESENSTYVKASNTDTADFFGISTSITDDGSRMAIGAFGERSNATGVNGDETNNDEDSAGAVYVFSRSGSTWTQEAYIKASNTEADDQFGYHISLSGDGTRLAVASRLEASNSTGINGNQFDNSANGSGAVYVFSRSGTTWSQEAYIKSSNSESLDLFGSDVSLSDDGSRMVVGASAEDSNATGVNGNQTDNSVSASGAAYVFSRSGSTWTQEAYLKASNTGANDNFGEEVAISGDGVRIVIAATREGSNATGINGDQTNNTANSSGASYVFFRSGTTWSQEAYIKASNSAANDRFGNGVSITNDGSRLVVSAGGEDSNATGINGDETNNSAGSSGAAYVFLRSGTTWSQEAYVKASNPETNDAFGLSGIAISGDGTRLVVGARGEDSIARGLNGDETSNSVSGSGAAYGFTRVGTTWSQTVYIKSSNSETSDLFGSAMSLSLDGTYVIIATISEDSNATGINGDQTNNSNSAAGVGYLITPF